MRCSGGEVGGTLRWLVHPRIHLLCGTDEVAIDQEDALPYGGYVQCVYSTAEIQKMMPNIVT